MIDDVIEEKLDEMIDLMNKNSKIIRMKELKYIIYNDDYLKKIFNEYRLNETIKLKKEIIENELIKEYRKLENELYFTILEINKKLNKLINKKVCEIESN